MKKNKEKERELIYSTGEPYDSWIGVGLRNFVRKNGLEASDSDVIWSYFLWLMKSVGLNGPDKNQEYRKLETDDKTYFMLAIKLFRTEFKPVVFDDRNRIKDAKLLREDFALSCSRFQNYSAIDLPGASFLEVMIALCQKFDTRFMMKVDDPVERWHEWFWLMLKNVDLDDFCDSKFNYDFDFNIETGDNPDILIDSILKIINDRTYKENGKGGFFPLKNPKNDQRKVELWYQMNAYFLENLID